MENRPHIAIVGQYVPPDIEEKYLMWNDEVYTPTYVKVVGSHGIDRYQITKRTLEYPGTFMIYHRPNRKEFEESKKKPARHDLQRDLGQNVLQSPMGMARCLCSDRELQKRFIFPRDYLR